MKNTYKLLKLSKKILEIVWDMKNINKIFSARKTMSRSLKRNYSKKKGKLSKKCRKLPKILVVI